MSQKKARLARKIAKYKIADDPIRSNKGQKRKYAKKGSKRIDTGAGKSVTVGGNLVNIGPRAIYKKLLKQKGLKKSDT